MDVCMYVCMYDDLCVSVCCVRQVESARFRPALDPQNKQRLHAFALAMGAEDPLRGTWVGGWVLDRIGYDCIG